ncbi:MAG: hypothetical protein HOW73_15785 [Polyangiaceae bacterium]|nr:hypothetical protein [Polyangiaceae bacterium]
MARLWPWGPVMNASLPLALLSALTLTLAVGCDATVTDGDDDPQCEDGACQCPADGCPASCPVSQPADGEPCNVDMLECSYPQTEGGECVSIFRCEPVYPEAGAPSQWSYVTDSGDCEQCLAAPACADFEEQVDSCEGVDPSLYDCHSVTTCGQTIYCIQSTCDLPPACDPGDTPTNECPPGGCYVVESCGSTVACVDSALPQHGCPPVEPEPGMVCDGSVFFCDYPDGRSCFSSYSCTDGGEWEWAGGGCKEPA